jgi:pyruvate kinase
LRSIQLAATPEDAALAGVARDLIGLEASLAALESDMRAALARVPEETRESARNLVHYVALRQHDLRELQVQLAQLGLSSLSHCEGCVRASLLEVSRRAQEVLAFRDHPRAKREADRLAAEQATALSWQAAKDHLHRNTREMFGPRPDDRHVYIMVTAPSAKEADRAWMVRMLHANMSVLRINCAHEGPNEWHRMVTALKDARRETGKECRILMDLAGPKIRTGPVAGMRHVATWKPSRDEVGRVRTPARVVVRRTGAPPVEGTGAVPLFDDAVFATIRPGDEVRFRDARGKKRTLTIHSMGDDQCVGLADEHAYVVDRTRAYLWRGKRRVDAMMIHVAGEGSGIDIRVGEEVVLSRSARKGAPPKRDRDGHVVRRAVVVCTLPEVLDNLAVGHRVLFDDGRVEAVVMRKTKRGDYVLSIARTQKETIKLRAEKGINLPDTSTSISAVTDDDVRALAFVARHADAVSMSFVSRQEDVRRVHEELDRRKRPHIGVVLKIETRSGFENLPRLLLEGLRRPPLAVMIARGDLAVEVGFERLAELQEEILWLCEASHVPAIWATQVLDTLARTGVPSRAEVTDAAASVAAECVMLNKGPFVGEAVRVLSGILQRMEKHRYKKRSLFRRLKVSTFE